MCSVELGFLLPSVFDYRLFFSQLVFLLPFPFKLLCQQFLSSSSAMQSCKRPTIGVHFHFRLYFIQSICFGILFPVFGFRVFNETTTYEILSRPFTQSLWLLQASVRNHTVGIVCAPWNPRVTRCNYKNRNLFWMRRDFSTEESSKFINGILHKIKDDLIEKGEMKKEGRGLIDQSIE